MISKVGVETIFGPSNLLEICIVPHYYLICELSVYVDAQVLGHDFFEEKLLSLMAQIFGHRFPWVVA